MNRRARRRRVALFVGLLSLGPVLVVVILASVSLAAVAASESEIAFLKGLAGVQVLIEPTINDVVSALQQWIGPQTALERAATAYERKQYAEAIAQARAVVAGASGPVRAEGWLVVGRAQLRLKDYPAALAAFDQAAAEPGIEPALLYRAREGSAMAYQDQRPWEEALRRWEEIATSSPDAAQKSRAREMVSALKVRLGNGHGGIEGETIPPLFFLIGLAIWYLVWRRRQRGRPEWASEQAAAREKWRSEWASEWASVRAKWRRRLGPLLHMTRRRFGPHMTLKTRGKVLTLCGVALLVYSLLDPTWDVGFSLPSLPSLPRLGGSHYYGSHYHYGVAATLGITAGAVLIVAGVFSYIEGWKRPPS